jgi:flagellar biosynthesis/type III secretory pathway M-ring protein FliF/YscJ
MPGAERAEIYFIVAMMVLILIVSFTAVFFFVRQYKKEMRERAERNARKMEEKARQEQ